MKLNKRVVATDALLAVAVLTACLMQLWSSGGPTTVGIAGAVSLAGAMLVWRRHPWTAMHLVFITVVLESILGLSTAGPYGEMLAGMVAIYAVASSRGRRETLAALAYGLAMVAWSAHSHGFVNYLWALIILGAAAGVGRTIQSRRRLVLRLETALAELQGTRHELVAAALAAERMQIARELHDVIAHAVSVMVIQATAAERMLDVAPRRSRVPLRAVQDSGSQALAELRRLLDVLRTDPDTHATLEPAPGLADLDGLIASVRAAGVDVRYDHTGNCNSLPVGVNQAAYRIVQEALTNVLKHADATHVEVCVNCDTDTVEVQVIDNGRGTWDADSPAAGHGIAGMRERAAAYHGELAAQPTEHGGFIVNARLMTTAEL